MDRLWSPWRAQHVARWAQTPDEGAASEARPTLFERLAADHRDEDNLIVWRGTHVFVLMNLYPYTNGHLMIVPYRPVAEYEALDDAEQVELARTLARCLRWLRQALQPDGFNTGMNLGSAAGAGIPNHLHLHVVPRWNGDTNFMPVVGATKVIPEGLRDTYGKIQAVIAADEDR
ncbi:MAG: HIT domain-containing protein [Bacteroidota bacterium]